MIEIRKEIVNGIGNVQHSEHIAFVDCFANAVFNNLKWDYNRLAQAETKQFALRGQDTYVRYVFIPIDVKSIDKAIAYADIKVREVIADCNDYIRQANRAYSISNKRRGLIDKSLAIKEITVGDLVFGENNDRYCVVVGGEK